VAHDFNWDNITILDEDKILNKIDFRNDLYSQIKNRNQTLKDTELLELIVICLQRSDVFFS